MTVTLEQFEDRTSLLPGVIAGIVSSDDREFTAWAVNRTIALYNRNTNFHRRMHLAARREWLYAFMAHWFDAWQKRGGRPQ